MSETTPQQGTWIAPLLEPLGEAFDVTASPGVGADGPGEGASS